MNGQNNVPHQRISVVCSSVVNLNYVLWLRLIEKEIPANHCRQCPIKNTYALQQKTPTGRNLQCSSQLCMHPL